MPEEYVLSALQAWKSTAQVVMSSGVVITAEDEVVFVVIGSGVVTGISRIN